MRAEIMKYLTYTVASAVIISGQASSSFAAGPNGSKAPAASSDASGGDSASKTAEAANNPLDPNWMHWQTQTNFNFKQGPSATPFDHAYKRTQVNTRFQPLIPIHLPGDWTFLMRPIFQVNTNPRKGPGHHLRKRFGVADFVPQFYFLAPIMKFGDGWDLTLGAGPAFQIPFDDGTLSSHRFAVGPDAAISLAHGPLRASVIGQIVWSVDHKNKAKYPKTKASSIQYNISYSFNNGFYLVTTPLISIDWKAHGRKVTLPFGGGFGQAFKLGGHNIAADIQAYYNVERQRQAPRWQLRLQTTVLLKNPLAGL